MTACSVPNDAGDGSVSSSGRNSGSGDGGGGNYGGRTYDGGNKEMGSALTSGQESALGSAEDYLSMSGFSRTGLIEQLEFEGYSTKNASFAVDHLNIDWNEQAARSAEDYLSMSGFSRMGLIEQLVFEGFTQQEAQYGAGKALGGGSNRNGGPGLTPGQKNALASAEDYLSMSGFSRTGLIDQLEFEGYSTKDASFAVDHLNVDWNKQAARSAKDYLSFSSFSRSALIEQLVFEGYTPQQATYGADKAL